MKNAVACFLVLVVTVSLVFTSVPNVCGQAENVEVLNYTWYVSSYGSLVVVGELQNVGSKPIEFINLVGIAYSVDGAEADSITSPFSRQILPQQKVPFLMYFFPEHSYYGDLKWIERGISYIEFIASSSNETDDYQYPDLEIINDSSYINATGVYKVTGQVRNTGTQAAGKLWVVATFYNATGDVIIVDFSDYLVPDYLQPGETADFTIDSTAAIPELAYEFTALADEITGYSLVVQTEGPIIPEFPSWTILPLFLVATLVVLIGRKKLAEK